jgi:steroid delta-isomerase-like uncharacterized protein
MMRKIVLLGIAFSLLVGLLGSCSGVNKAELDAFNAAKTKAEENKSLMRSYYEDLNRGDFNALGALLSPNYKRYSSATSAPLNADGQKARLAGLRAAFPDLQLTVENIIAEGDFVAISLTARGTHQGTFQGIPPTGKSVTVSAFEVVRIENGKLAEHWGGPDTLNLLQQIGAVISAGK